jgi:hypothetical protein
VPPLAVDDVDAAATAAALQGGAGKAISEVFGSTGANSKKARSKRRRPRAARGVPEAVAPEEAEEVDPFTAEIVLKDVACLKLGVHGAGKESELHMEPKVQILPGPVMPDMPTTFELTVTNISDAEVGYEWAQGRVRNDASQGLPFTLRFSPPTGRLQPMEVVSVTCEFTGHSPGSYDIDLPCMVEAGPAEGVCTRMICDVVGPVMQIVEPEIDFGLIGVGECSELIMHLHNTSAVAAHWSFAETDTESIRARLADMVEEETERRQQQAAMAAESRRGRRNSNNNDDEGANEDALIDRSASPMQLFASAMLNGINSDNRCRILFNPLRGVLEAGQKMTVTVMCFSGRLPQRLRHPLECVVQHGTSSFCRSRAEVQAPKVYLEESVVDLKNTYVGVPRETTLHVKNLSNLPAKFAFARMRDPSNAGVHSIFDIEFSPSEGILSEKELLVVKVKYTGTCSNNAACVHVVVVFFSLVGGTHTHTHTHSWLFTLTLLLFLFFDPLPTFKPSNRAAWTPSLFSTSRAWSTRSGLGLTPSQRDCLSRTRCAMPPLNWSPQVPRSAKGGGMIRRRSRGALSPTRGSCLCWTLATTARCKSAAACSWSFAITLPFRRAFRLT